MGSSPSSDGSVPDVFRYWTTEPEDIQHRCIFCKIASARIKPGRFREGELVYRDADVAVFHDIAPAADVHLLVVPVRHVKNCWDPRLDESLLKKMLEVYGDHEEHCYNPGECGTRGGSSMRCWLGRGGCCVAMSRSYAGGYYLHVVGELR